MSHARAGSSAEGSLPLPLVTGEAASAYRDWLLAGVEQAMDDLSVAGAAEVVFVRDAGKGTGEAFASLAADRALQRRFAVAEISVGKEHGFESFDVLVRGALEGLRARPKRNAEATGIFELLDEFATRHGKRSLALFDEQAEETAAAGDLVSLARAYIASAGEPRAEKRKLAAWLAGTPPPHVEGRPTALSALSPRTAKHALSELTRIVRALGYRGTLLLLTEGDTLLHLPPARREAAYTVLRELVDNADGGRGLFAARVMLFGSTELYTGKHSLASLTPLATRVSVLPGSTTLPPPHRPLVDLVVPRGWGMAPQRSWEEAPSAPEAVSPDPSVASPLRVLVRASQGLPPVESILAMSVGQEAIDAVIDRLFELAAMDGSVFALLTGDYGTGKTHLLLHFAARAAADRRPVFRLSLERLDVDLGNPQRHLRRMLEGATLPGRARATPIDRLFSWTRDEEATNKLVQLLEELAQQPDDVGRSAAKAVGRTRNPKTRAAALESFLGAVDLADKPGGASYRHDAYGRLLLWIVLLERLEKCQGPVLLIDEAENLYRQGISKPERRTALRSLSFYCGGALPRTCVVMAVTPDVLPTLRDEAGELLEEVSEQATVLEAEDSAMLRRRLVRIKPIPVPALVEAHRAQLLGRVKATHAKVRGRAAGRGWSKFAEELLANEGLSPRDLVRRATERLESAWWEQEGTEG